MMTTQVSFPAGVGPARVSLHSEDPTGPFAVIWADGDGGGFLSIHFRGDTPDQALQGAHAWARGLLAAVEVGMIRLNDLRPGEVSSDG